MLYFWYYAIFLIVREIIIYFLCQYWSIWEFEFEACMNLDFKVVFHQPSISRNFYKVLNNGTVSCGDTNVACAVYGPGEVKPNRNQTHIWQKKTSTLFHSFGKRPFFLGVLQFLTLILLCLKCIYALDNDFEILL